MAKVWVQVWTAQVPGSVEVEEALLREVEGLDSVKAMVPMFVQVEEKWSPMAQESDWEIEKDLLPPKAQEMESQLSKYQEKALAKGWGWVLRLEGHHRKSD